MGKKRSHTKATTNGDAESNAEELSGKTPKYEVNDLLTKINELIENFNYELALKFCEKALLIEPNNTKVLETMGNTFAELGFEDNAKQHFLKAVDLQPDEGHVKYLYLGQLSEGSEAVRYYKLAISMMTPSVDKNINNDNNLGNRDISNVYCSLAELYMTDCCMEEDAEKLCEESCQKALQLDEKNPEANLVMCNLLLTKGDIDSAKNIALKMFDMWKSLSEQDEDNIVDLISYESRMTLIKVLIEVELYDKVLVIGVQLLEENEEDIRIWYYIGLSKSLLDEVDGQRYYLDTALHLYDKNHHMDEDMLSHLNELISNCPVENEDIIEADVEQEKKSIDNGINVMDVDG